jgi:hypothetical protein
LVVYVVFLERIQAKITGIAGSRRVKPGLSGRFRTKMYLKKKYPTFLLLYRVGLPRYLIVRYIRQFIP